MLSVPLLSALLVNLFLVVCTAVVARILRTFVVFGSDALRSGVGESSSAMFDLERLVRGVVLLAPLAAVVR